MVWWYSESFSEFKFDCDCCHSNVGRLGRSGLWVTTNSTGGSSCELCCLFWSQALLSNMNIFCACPEVSCVRYHLHRQFSLSSILLCWNCHFLSNSPGLLLKKWQFQDSSSVSGMDCREVLFTILNTREFHLAWCIGQFVGVHPLGRLGIQEGKVGWGHAAVYNPVVVVDRRQTDGQRDTKTEENRQLWICKCTYFNMHYLVSLAHVFIATHGYVMDVWGKCGKIS